MRRWSYQTRFRPLLFRMEAERSHNLTILPVNQGLSDFREGLRRADSRVPVGVRLAHAPGAGPGAPAREPFALAEALREHAAFFTLERVLVAAVTLSRPYLMDRETA